MSSNYLRELVCSRDNQTVVHAITISVQPHQGPVGGKKKYVSLRLLCNEELNLTALINYCTQTKSCKTKEVRHEKRGGLAALNSD
jgi:hypothetical protein